MIMYFLSFSDPGLFVYCCDFSTTAVDLVQVKSVVTYAGRKYVVPIAHEHRYIVAVLAACFSLASPDADPCTGNKADEPSRIAEMRKVEALKMSHW